MHLLASAVRQCLAIINRLAESICCLILVVMVMIIVVQVLFRYVLSSPISWSEEVALLLLVWFALLSVAVAVYRHSHMAISLVYDHLSNAGQYWLNLTAQLLIAAFALNISINAGLLVELTDIQILPASAIPKAWLYLAPVVGGGLMAINAFGNLFLDRFVNENTDPSSGGPKMEKGKEWTSKP